MEVTPLVIPEVKLIAPRLFTDARGVFFESWNSAAFNAAIGRDVVFFQDNQSISARGVVRGLHYQLPPHAQAKLVRCVRGEVFDVAVDLRRSSPSFGKWVGAHLSAANHLQLWIPEGFAHGFVAVEDETTLVYKASAPYRREAERELLWNDPALAIDWKLTGPPILSGKDAAAPLLAQADTFA
ncbi:MAG TPA: dTDP-4-dehydrorhamnose 3,5-epimerase [Devosia sp.]|nr:dTDP-4-dehydrorhamnose 3,5-epimerase [Devosia sp.]